MSDRLRVGIIGVGNISKAYIDGCRDFAVLELVACADLDPQRANAAAAEHAIPHAMSVDDLLASDQVDLVINLTVPLVHAEVSTRIVAAGKHVYSEKPLGVTLEEGQAILAAADRAGVRVGCAPDTFLFANHQSVRRLVDDGAIGMPLAAVAFFASHGPEGWHPNPDFFYQAGAGPMLDMGPYYVTCLVNLLGAVKYVSGTAQATLPQRIAKDGHAIPVRVPTHHAATLEFASGAIATLITSFDVWAHHLPAMEIYGEHGSLTVPDPNGHDPREFSLFTPEQDAWQVQPLAYADGWKRGIGVADMAYAILENRAHRASGDLALHVLEVMTAVERAGAAHAAIEIASQPAQPAVLPLDFPQPQR
jgi:predicted dehydrogenase